MITDAGTGLQRKCYLQYTVTSRTPLHSRKRSFCDILVAIAEFVNGVLGTAALRLRRRERNSYKTPFTDTAEASPVVKLAARFLALTAQRPGMIRWLEWEDIREFNPEAGGCDTEAIWIAPAVKMKQELEQREDESFNHPVPLGLAASDVLREAWKFSAGMRRAKSSACPTWSVRSLS
ncbi:hypothetical protein [Nitrobacter sp.]|uniref:hypothetical protein n=1 Tax=Nitrobacter sp. TaxID=29420 RepID=UPI002620288A|nr:hypothetical protein [Nitrobacter sp.]